MMAQNSKIKTLSFSGLRRLNPFDCFAEGNEPFEIWDKNRDIHEMGDINIFAGRNGAGKSTVLDLVSFFSKPEKLCTLPRENRSLSAHSFICLTVSNGYTLRAAVNPNARGNDDATLKSPLDYQFAHLEALSPNQAVVSYSENIGKRTLDIKHENEILKLLAPFECKVSSWDREATLPVAKLAKALNKIDRHLAGLETDPYAPLEANAMLNIKRPVFSVNEDGLLGAFLSDDRTQRSNLTLSALPSGWLAAASILVYLEECEEHSICLLEEPETHMHPSLQRAVIQKILDIADKRKLQIFLSTHSMTFQSRYAWDGVPVTKFFEADTHKLHAGINERRILEMLGVSGAEYGACNGVIWVEGPSDRIYIKHWIQLYCDQEKIDTPQEHRDYSFAFHGGAVLAHFSAQDAKGRVDISRLNRNFILLMDRDNNIGDSVTPKKTNAAKDAFLKETEAINSKFCTALITPGYTIESSLPLVFRKNFLPQPGEDYVMYVVKKL